jgi:hypothetical protein
VNIFDQTRCSKWHGVSGYALYSQSSRYAQLERRGKLGKTHSGSNPQNPKTLLKSPTTPQVIKTKRNHF